MVCPVRYSHCFVLLSFVLVVLPVCRRSIELIIQALLRRYMGRVVITKPVVLGNIGYPPETHLKIESREISVSVVQSFWNFTQSTAVSLPCSVKIPKWSGNCKISYEQTRLREIWVYDLFRTDIYCTRPQTKNTITNFVHNSWDALYAVSWNLKLW